MRLTGSAIESFKKYANEYNNNPDSEQSDVTYDIFFNQLLNECEEDQAYEIAIILCRTENNKIDIYCNLMELC